MLAVAGVPSSSQILIGQEPLMLQAENIEYGDEGQKNIDSTAKVLRLSEKKLSSGQRPQEGYSRVTEADGSLSAYMNSKLHKKQLPLAGERKLRKNPSDHDRLHQKPDEQVSKGRAQVAAHLAAGEPVRRSAVLQTQKT